MEGFVDPDDCLPDEELEQDSESDDEMVGTEHYVAPETLKNEKQGCGSDIWALGVIIYQMLTAELPFDGKDENAVYEAIKVG